MFIIADVTYKTATTIKLMMALAASISTRVKPFLASAARTSRLQPNMIFFSKIFMVLSHFYYYVVVYAPLDILAFFAYA